MIIMAFSRKNVATTLQFCLFLTCTCHPTFSEPSDAAIQQPLNFKIANDICEKQGKKMAVVIKEQSEMLYDRHNIFWLRQNTDDTNDCIAIKYTTNYQLQQENCSENLYSVCEQDISECHENISQFQNNCYKFSKEVANFTDSNITCEQNDGSLTILNTTDEHDVIIHVISNYSMSSDNITEAEYSPPVWTGVIYHHTDQMWVKNDGIQVHYNLDFTLNDTQLLYVNATCFSLNITQFEIADCTKELSLLCIPSDKESHPDDQESSAITFQASSSTSNTNETEIETLPNNGTSQTTDVQDEQETSPNTFPTSNSTPSTTTNISENDYHITIKNIYYKYQISKKVNFKKANEICEYESKKLARFENNEVITTLINNYLKHKHEHFWVDNALDLTCMKIYWNDDFEISVEISHCNNNMFYICESGSQKYRLVRNRLKNENATVECARSGERLAIINARGDAVTDQELIKVFEADKYWNDVTKEDLDRNGLKLSNSDSFWVGQENGDLVKNCSKISFNQNATITNCEAEYFFVCEFDVEGGSPINVTYDATSIVTTSQHAALPNTISTTTTIPNSKQRETTVTSNKNPTKTSTMTSSTMASSTIPSTETLTSSSTSSNTSETVKTVKTGMSGLEIGAITLAVVLLLTVLILVIVYPDKFKEYLQRLGCLREQNTPPRPEPNNQQGVTAPLLESTQNAQSQQNASRVVQDTPV